MKNYVTPEMNIETLNLCDILTTSRLTAFAGRGEDDAYKGGRTHINSI